MSKVKEFYYKALEESFAFDFGYEEYLREQQEPTDGEIQQMEQDFSKPSFIYNSSSISNNLYYDNPKGA